MNGKDTKIFLAFFIPLCTIGETVLRAAWLQQLFSETDASEKSLSSYTQCSGTNGRIKMKTRTRFSFEKW